MRDYTLKILDSYKENRDIPYNDQTSYLSVHLRFGTVSVREIINQLKGNEVFLSELIWREFFMQILYNFPHVVNNSFKSKYDKIEWRNNKEEFKKWCEGKTGYPIVDAGMRQLNQTGYMHNRVRMIVAGFLCKHLLIDWRWERNILQKNFLIMSFHLIMVTGSGQQVQDVMLHPILEFSTHLLSKKSLIRNLSKKMD